LTGAESKARKKEKGIKEIRAIKGIWEIGRVTL